MKKAMVKRSTQKMWDRIKKPWKERLSSRVLGSMVRQQSKICRAYLRTPRKSRLSHKVDYLLSQTSIWAEVHQWTAYLRTRKSSNRLERDPDLSSIINLALKRLRSIGWKTSIISSTSWVLSGWWGTQWATHSIAQALILSLSSSQWLAVSRGRWSQSLKKPPAYRRKYQDLACTTMTY